MGGRKGEGGKERGSNGVFSSYMQGVLALNGVLSLQENAESSLRALFGDDVGVAFFILGKLKYQLQHKPDAAKCFRAALRFNPFLWSAFSMLCEMGEEVGPEECFKVTEYPTFLASRSSVAQSVAMPSLSSECVRPKPECAQPQASVSTPFSPMETKKDNFSTKIGSRDGHSSAFKPVQRSKPVFMTPDIFQDPPVGNAMASSTPATSEPRNRPRREKLPLALGSARRTEGWLRAVGALDFGSSERSSASKVTPLGPSPATPLNPRYALPEMS